jgi:hypothetical protein
MAQVIECLFSKCKTVSSRHSFFVLCFLFLDKVSLFVAQAGLEFAL